MSNVSMATAEPTTATSTIAPTTKHSLLSKLKQKLRGLFRRKKKDLEIYPLF